MRINSVGTDLCRISRIHDVLRDPRRGGRFIRRVLNPSELERAPEPVRLFLRATDAPTDAERADAARTLADRDREEGITARAAAFIAGRLVVSSRHCPCFICSFFLPCL